MATLNPYAAPYHPHALVPLEPFLPRYVVSSPPPPDCFYLYQPTTATPYVFDVVNEDNNHLHADNTDQNLKKQVCVKVDTKRVSTKQRLFSAIYGRRHVEPRRVRAKGFRPPSVGRRPNGNPKGNGGADQQIQVQALVSFRASPRKTKQPVVPVRSDGKDTTIMIRNIPNKYTREMLVEFLENHCLAENQKENEQNGVLHMMSTFDLVYLPIDFNTRLNKGYAFVNFTNPMAAWKFHVAINKKKWEFFQSHKICEVVAAHVQGKEKLQNHLESMSFPCEWEDVLPVCFSPPRDGTNKGSQRTLGKLTHKLLKKDV